MPIPAQPPDLIGVRQKYLQIDEDLLTRGRMRSRWMSCLIPRDPDNRLYRVQVDVEILGRRVRKRLQMRSETLASQANALSSTPDR
jgi:hypothetical protein